MTWCNAKIKGQAQMKQTAKPGTYECLLEHWSRGVTCATGVSLSVANNHTLAIFVYLLASLFHLGDACVYVCIRNEKTHTLSNLSFVVTFSFTHIHTHTLSLVALQKKDTSMKFWAERNFFLSYLWHFYDDNCDKTRYHHRCGIIIWQKIKTKNGPFVLGGLETQLHEILWAVHDGKKLW